MTPKHQLADPLQGGRSSLYPFAYLRICLFAYLLIVSAFNHSLFVTFLSFPLICSPLIFYLLGFNISLFARQASVCLYGCNKSTQYLVDFICSQLGQGSWYIWDLVQEKYIVLEDTKPRAKRTYTVSTMSHICFAKRKISWQNFIFIPGTQVSKVSSAIPDFLSPYLKHLPWGVKNSNWHPQTKLQDFKLTSWLIG